MSWEILTVINILPSDFLNISLDMRVSKDLWLLLLEGILKSVWFFWNVFGKVRHDWFYVWQGNEMHDHVFVKTLLFFAHIPLSPIINVWKAVFWFSIVLKLTLLGSAPSNFTVSSSECLSCLLTSWLLQKDVLTAGVDVKHAVLVNLCKGNYKLNEFFLILFAW